jgi:hypothetical protein
MMSIGILTSLLLAALRFETTQIHALSLRPSSRRETRYFSQQLVAPPLAPLADMSNIESSHHQELPILYTNDPRVVSQWLQEHVDRNGCVLGFDVEVCSIIIVVIAILWYSMYGRPIGTVYRSPAYIMARRTRISVTWHNSVKQERRKKEQ